MNAIRFAKCISTTLAVSFAAGSLAGGELPSAAGGKPGRDSYVECWGVDARVRKGLQHSKHAIKPRGNNTQKHHQQHIK